MYWEGAERSHQASSASLAQIKLDACLNEKRAVDANSGREGAMSSGVPPLRGGDLSAPMDSMRAAAVRKSIAAPPSARPLGGWELREVEKRSFRRLLGLTPTQEAELDKAYTKLNKRMAAMLPKLEQWVAEHGDTIGALEALGGDPELEFNEKLSSLLNPEQLQRYDRYSEQRFANWFSERAHDVVMNVRPLLGLSGQQERRLYDGLVAMYRDIDEALIHAAEGNYRNLLLTTELAPVARPILDDDQYETFLIYLTVRYPIVNSPPTNAP